MADVEKDDKQSIRHQVNSMYKSIRAQEHTIVYLKEQGTDKADDKRAQLIEETEAAHAELVARMEFLTVAYDYD